ncbi:MAG: hypothetical protein V1873_00230 [Verrucomicrobiota bacterium]
MIILALLLSGTSCATRQFTSNAVLFRTKHPEIAACYVKLSEMSFDSAAMFQQMQQDVLVGVAEQIEKRADDPAELRRYAKWLKTENQRPFEWHDEYKSLQRKLKPTDSVYHYEYIKGDVRDVGTLILRNGNIVYRDAIAVSDDTELINDL